VKQILKVGSGIPRYIVSVSLLSVFVGFANCQHQSESAVRPRRTASSAGENIRVKKGEDLQAAIEAAQSGQTLLLEAGAAYGPIVLPSKPPFDGAYITIQTEGFLSPVRDGERVSPSQASTMARILSTGGRPAVGTAPRAHHYRFVGIEFAPGADAPYVYNLIDLGGSDYGSLEQFPHHLTFDRCYVHSTGLNKARRGFALNSGETSIINSHVSGFAGESDETQAIAGWNGPGPFNIVNNFLEAGGEVILFGGSDPSITNLVPSDIKIQRNYLHRPPEWRGRALIKGTFELKNAKRVVIDGNVLESKIMTTAFVLTVRNQNGRAPWSTLEDVTVTNNVVRGATSGFNILGTDNEHSSQTAHGIRISNNLLLNVVPDEQKNIAYFLQINGGDLITIEHNTVQQSGNIVTSYGRPTTNFVFKDNIVQYGLYGLVCMGDGPPCKDGGPFCRCFPNAVIKGNVIADSQNALKSDASISSRYPPGNSFVESFDKISFVDSLRDNWQLATNSKFRGRSTDGADPGVNFSALIAAGAISANK
jgi:hypothetical protein